MPVLERRCTVFHRDSRRSFAVELVESVAAVVVGGAVDGRAVVASGTKGVDGGRCRCSHSCPMNLMDDNSLRAYT